MGSLYKTVNRAYGVYKGQQKRLSRYGTTQSQVVNRMYRNPPTRPYRNNAQYRISNTYHRHTQWDTADLNKGTLKTLNIADQITVGHAEGQRNGTQLYAKGLWINFIIDNNNNASPSCFRAIALTYADYKSVSGDDLFKDIIGNTSSAVNFTALDDTSRIITAPFNKNTVGILKEYNTVIGVDGGSPPNIVLKRMYVPLNRAIQYEGPNSLPNIRIHYWHQPNNGADTPILTITAQTTLVYKNVV